MKMPKPVNWIDKVCYLCSERIVYLRCHVRKHPQVSIEEFIVNQLHDGKRPTCACGCSRNTKLHSQRWVFNQFIHGHSTIEQRLKLSSLLTGSKHCQFGKQRSAETKTKISKAVRAYRENHPDECAAQFQIFVKRGSGYMSKLHCLMRSKLSLGELGFKSEQNAGGFRVDELHETGVVVEICGDHVHANPKLFTATDHIAGYGYSASQKWIIDAKKYDSLRNQGFDVIVIWESDELTASKFKIEEAIRKKSCV